MDKNKKHINFIKEAVSLVGTACVEFTAIAIIESVLPPQAKLGAKLACAVGTYIIGCMAANAAHDYFNEVYDAFFDELDTKRVNKPFFQKKYVEKPI